jgi:hypothetical protein
MRTNLCTIFATLAGLIVANPAIAVPITFVQYFQANGSTQQWSVSTSGTETSVAASGDVFLLFSGTPGLPFSGPEAALFTLTATSDQPGSCGVNCGPGDSFVQPGYTGTFSFIDEAAAPGTNLLSGTFAVTMSPSTTGAQFSSSIGSTGGSFNASATAGNLDQLIFTSDYVLFLPSITNANASFSLSSVIPIFSTGTVTGSQAYPSSSIFDASGSGTFSVNTASGSIPEPTSLALLSLSLIGVGLAHRHKATRTALTNTSGS